MRTFECNLVDGGTIEVPKDAGIVYSYENKKLVMVSGGTHYPCQTSKKIKFEVYKNRHDKRASDNHKFLGTVVMLSGLEWYIFEVVE